MALSPIVYCKSDSAHLCLSCDAKVHSANALSYRHPRTLVCESCRYRPASVRCFDHEMFMCQNCDTSHHRVSFQHHKKDISCYVGCPSAKDLAVLWGFGLDELEKNCVAKDQSVCSSLTTADYGHDVNSSVSKMSCSKSGGSSSLMSDIDGTVSVVYTEFEGGSSSRRTKVVKDNNWQRNSYLIRQQINDLESLQLSEGIVDNSCLLHVKERTGGLPFKHDTMWKFHTNLNNQMESFSPNLHFQHMGGSPLEDKTEEPLSSPFSQLDNFTSTGNPDSFWQYKSPAHNNEIWLQNMQDLGVCDEVQCFDDVNIPDVDLTFRNFEEFFGSEHEPIRALVDDENMTCSFADKHPSFASTIEQSNAADKEMDMSDQIHQLQWINYRPHPIRPCYSASSFSVSRITGESSGSEYKDDELSPTFPKQILQHGTYDSDNTKLDAKENVIMRYKEKKVLRHGKQAQYTSPKSKSGGKK
ncbi:hypothetical protein DH2020_020705 [Rehmannia glutinosa]|uniref:B box-type domain-containing protein n=1 Tax=Rehmannia glutinosa TaxID=99300 RepID=A0ABR0WJQ7_REHGL